MDQTVIRNKIELTYLQNIFPKHKIDHILMNQTRLNRNNKLEITPYITSDFCGLNLNFNKRKNKRQTNSWKLNNFLWNYDLVKAEIKKLETS